MISSYLIKPVWSVNNQNYVIQTLPIDTTIKLMYLFVLTVIVFFIWLKFWSWLKTRNWG